VPRFGFGLTPFGPEDFGGGIFRPLRGLIRTRVIPDGLRRGLSSAPSELGCRSSIFTFLSRTQPSMGMETDSFIEPRRKPMTRQRRRVAQGAP